MRVVCLADSTSTNLGYRHCDPFSRALRQAMVHVPRARQEMSPTLEWSLTRQSYFAKGFHPRRMILNPAPLRAGKLTKTIIVQVLVTSRGEAPLDNLYLSAPRPVQRLGYAGCLAGKTVGTLGW